MNIAFFDFDNTLVKGDSLFAFLKFYYRKKSVAFAFKMIAFLPCFLAFKLKLMSRNNAKEKLFVLFFKGESRDSFLNKAAKFANDWIPKNLKKEAMHRLKWHLEQNDEVVIVSASIEAYLAPFAKKENLKLIGSRLDLSSETMSGKFLLPNCYGQEKVNRILEKYSLEKYNSSFAYGDSRGDKEMLEIVKHPFYRSFT